MIISNSWEADEGDFCRFKTSRTPCRTAWGRLDSTHTCRHGGTYDWFVFLGAINRPLNDYHPLFFFILLLSFGWGWGCFQWAIIPVDRLCS